MNKSYNPIDISKGLQCFDAKSTEFYALAKDFAKVCSSYTYQNSLLWHEFIRSTYLPDIDFSVIFATGSTPVAFFLCFGYLTDCGRIKLSMDSFGGGLPHPLFNQRLSKKQRRSLIVLFLQGLRKSFQEQCVDLASLSYTFSCLDLDDGDVFQSPWIDLIPSPPSIDLETVIDLGCSNEFMWSQLRHSFKSTINKGLKQYEFKCFDQRTISDDHLELHMHLHELCAGRKTRSPESFKSMHNFVVASQGLFHVQYLDKVPVQTLYTLFGHQAAYGGSMALNPNVDIKVPPTHSLNWKMLLDLKRYNITRYHTRTTSLWSAYAKGNADETAKLRNLSLFKAGLGGLRKPLLGVTFKDLDSVIELAQ